MANIRKKASFFSKKPSLFWWWSSCKYHKKPCITYLWVAQVMGSINKKTPIATKT
jgi:hypothetical protein